MACASHRPATRLRRGWCDPGLVFLLRPGRLSACVSTPTASAWRPRSRAARARQRRLKGDGDHGREYTTSKIEKIESRSPLPRCACGDFVRRVRASAPLDGGAPSTRLRSSCTPTQPSHLTHHCTRSSPHRRARRQPHGGPRHPARPGVSGGVAAQVKGSGIRSKSSTPACRATRRPTDCAARTGRSKGMCGC